MENGRREHKSLPALRGLQDLFCLLLSGAFSQPQVVSFRTRAEQPSLMARARALLQSASCAFAGGWPVANLQFQGGQTAQSSCLCMQQPAELLGNQAEAILFLNHRPRLYFP